MCRLNAEIILQTIPLVRSLILKTANPVFVWLAKSESIKPCLFQIHWPDWAVIQ